MTAGRASAFVAAVLAWAVGAAALDFAADSAPALTVAVAPPTARVGDVVEATLTLEVPTAPERKPAFPDWQDHWGNAEIRAVGDVVETIAADGASRYVQKLSLTSFRPGAVDLPAPVVTLTAAAGSDPEWISATEPAGFEVVSVLPPPGEEALEPKPPEPPRALRPGATFWWAAAILTALALALLALVQVRRPAAETFAGETVDPWTALEMALARLAAATDAETVFTGLSLELRRYLGHRLSFPAAESTTTELRRRLLKCALPAGVCADVVRLLVEADTVKFAKQTPTTKRLSRCLDEARAAAGAVRAALEPEASENDEERAA